MIFLISKLRLDLIYLFQASFVRIMIVEIKMLQILSFLSMNIFCIHSNVDINTGMNFQNEIIVFYHRNYEHSAINRAS